MFDPLTNPCELCASSPAKESLRGITLCASCYLEETRKDSSRYPPVFPSYPTYDERPWWEVNPVSFSANNRVPFSG